MFKSLVPIVAVICVPVWLAGCGNTRFEEPEEYVSTKAERDRIRYGTIHGNPEGFLLFSTNRNRSTDGADGGPGGGIAVNPFLWRAALETIDFMPLTQTDPLGGVIITDWYTPPESPNERFKLNVYILDRALRADGIKVSVFRQSRDDAGWNDTAVDPTTATGIEDNILTRARELRVASAGSAES